ncbi:MAG: ribosome silencing factor [Ruminococcus sp.]|nr:ribosome silencing factor [Ruminococcus sp.]
MAEQKQVIETIVKALDSKRAEDIQVIGIGELTILGDYFIIANGTSTTHTRTLADEVDYKMSELGLEPIHREGRGNGSNWIVLDYGDVIVHVFYKEARDFYQLERMWADGEHMDISQWLKKD